MEKDRILWVDDEIDLLKPHIIFLQNKGYEVTTANNGQDAIDLFKKGRFDIIFLDENMPGLSGLETLTHIKEINSAVPVVMITKSEEENIMDMAIGSKIADYLIKPVNPNQILLTLKKNIHKKHIISERTTNDYRSEFGKIGMQINDSFTFDDWKEIYKKLVYWELELNNAENEMDELLKMQKTEANTNFVKYIKKNYEKWFENPGERPLISPEVFQKKLFPLLDAGEKVFFILIDNFRFDQWKLLKDILAEFYDFPEEDIYASILPTATQYSRNAIFGGLMPIDLQKMFPDLWVDEDEEEGKNLNEEELIQTQINRFRKKYTFSYHKILDNKAGEKLVENLSQIINNQLNVAVFNFVDMLSHARTDSKMIKELVGSEAAYRSLTISWFKHSPLYELLKVLSKKDCKVIITTDHGTVHVDNPIKVVGDKSTNTNLRYKVGKNLAYNKKEVFEIKEPAKIGLPSPNLSSTYIFATNEDFFAYPNNYNYYAGYYKNTFQHGGISMEEMLIPIVTLEPKKK
jgi:DNA-binding response OmpR family regulator